MAHERGSVGPCMGAQSGYWFFRVTYLFLTLISRDDRNFRMQFNFYKELHPYSCFFSWAPMKERELVYWWNWSWFFNKTIQQKQHYKSSSILVSHFVSQFILLSLFHILSWTGYLIRNWRNQHQALDLSVPSTYTSCLWDFLNKKSELACELIWYMENMLCRTLSWINIALLILT